MIPSSNIIPMFVAIPLGGAFLTALLGRKIKVISDIFGFLATSALLGMAIYGLKLVTANGLLLYKVGGWIPPFGIAMVLDGLTVFMLITVNLIAFLVVLFSVNYMEQFTSKWQFYSLFLLMLAGMNGVIITGDLFNLFVFLEIAAVASYALVAFGTGKHELEAAFKYGVMGTLGSLFILLGIVWLYAYTSTLNMADMAITLQGAETSRITILAAVLFLAGFGLKAAIVPFHAWLPDAHPSAPAPISAMLSGVLIKSLGIYAICRVFFTILGITPQISTILLVLGAVSMGLGVIMALGQWDLKRLLAYSSISQIGYILMGIGIGTPLGILAALFHLFNHSVFKSLLFLGSGAIEYSTGTRDLKKMGGLGGKLPFTGASFLAGSMSIAGIPPFAGFWSKLLIIAAAIQAGLYGYAVWAILASILTLAYMMKAMKYAFLGNLRESLKGIREVPFLMKLSMGLLAVLCIAGGLLLIPGVREVFLYQAQNVLISGTEIAARIMSEVR